MQVVVNEPAAPEGTFHTPAALRQRVGRIAAPIALLLLWFVPTNEDPRAQHAVAISAFMVVLWATEAIPYAAASLLGLAAFWAFGISPLSVVASGFRQDTTWFLAGAMLLGVMASGSGLARRMAYSIGSRLGTSYSRLLLAFIAVDFCLTFVIPSGIARVTILSAVVVGLVQALGLGPRDNVSRGLLVIITYSAGIFDKMILAGAASILGRGLIASIAGETVPYAQWFIAYLPCDVVTILVCWQLVLWLYPARSPQLSGGAAYFQEQLTKLGGWSASEKRAAVLLALAVMLWMTDFIHGLRPATVAVAMSLLAFVPGVGVLAPRDLLRLRLNILVFAAAALSLSAVLADSNGLNVLTRSLVSWLEPFVAEPYTSTLTLYWTAFVCHLFLGSEIAMLSATLPPVLDFARAQGLAQLPVGMIWIFASGGKIFAYQSAVLMVGYAQGYFDARDLLKVGFILSIVECVILLLLVPFYWPLVGIT
jgi:anion transporter